MMHGMQRDRGRDLRSALVMLGCHRLKAVWGLDEYFDFKISVARMLAAELHILATLDNPLLRLMRGYMVNSEPEDKHSGHIGML